MNRVWMKIPDFYRHLLILLSVYSVLIFSSLAMPAFAATNVAGFLSSAANGSATNPLSMLGGYALRLIALVGIIIFGWNIVRDGTVRKMGDVIKDVLILAILLLVVTDPGVFVNIGQGINNQMTASTVAP